MRLKSDFWVKAYLRQAAAHGCSGYVVRHGDDEAGAIFIKVVRRGGVAQVFGPAPSGLEDADRERRWLPLLKGQVVEEYVADDLIAQQGRYDSDLWVVEIESADGAHFLDGWLLATPS